MPKRIKDKLNSAKALLSDLMNGREVLDSLVKKTEIEVEELKRLEKKEQMRQRADTWVLPVVFALFFIVNTITLYHGHNWGDDFAQYVGHAINLVMHRPYNSNIAIDLWVTVPPGYPALLSALIYWFGFNFKVLKFLNVILWAGAALCAYGIASKRVSRMWARVITILFLTSPFFFWFKQNLISDVAFTFFVLLSLWSFLKYEAEGRPIHKYLAVFAMTFSFLIRWAGIGLLIAVLIYYWDVKKNWRKSLLFILGGVVAWCIQLSLGAAQYFNPQESTLTFKNWIIATWTNTSYVVLSIWQFFMNDNIVGPKVAYVLGPMVLIGLIGHFIYKVRVRKMTAMDCFIFVYLLGVFLWPVQGGPRYIIPVIVPIMIYFVEWFKKFRITKYIAMAFIAYNLVAVSIQWKFNDDDLEKPDSIAMMLWVQGNIKEGEGYMFNKPRAITLMTGKPAAAFWVFEKDQKEWYRRIKPLNIQYIVADKSKDEIAKYDDLTLPVDDYRLHFSKVWENNQFKVLRVE